MADGGWIKEKQNGKGTNEFKRQRRADEFWMKNISIYMKKRKQMCTYVKKNCVQDILSPR